MATGKWVSGSGSLDFSPTLHACIRVYMGVYTCVWAGGHKEAREHPACCFSGGIHLVLFCEIESLTGAWGLPSRLVWLSIETQASSYSCLPGTGFTGLCHHARLFTWVVRPSCLYGKHTIEGAITSAPFLSVLNWAVWNWTGYTIPGYFKAIKPGRLGTISWLQTPIGS